MATAWAANKVRLIRFRGVAGLALDCVAGTEVGPSDVWEVGKDVPPDHEGNPFCLDRIKAQYHSF